MTNITKWMGWEGGIDLVAFTEEGAPMPNVIIHHARMVNTPVGSAPSGMVFWQPDSAAPPLVFGFVGTDAKVGAYFGPNIFAGTPFEQAPLLDAKFDIQINADKATSRLEVAGFVFEIEMSGFGNPYLINREPAAMSPFTQQGVEVEAKNVVLKVNGETIQLIIPPVSITGGPAVVVAPTGLYAR
jgi:hypothetical protein